MIIIVVYKCIVVKIKIEIKIENKRFLEND